jgi:hypothetical protein
LIFIEDKLGVRVVSAFELKNGSIEMMIGVLVYIFTFGIAGDSQLQSSG